MEQTTLRFFRTSIELNIDGSKFTPLSESYSKPDVKHYRVESSKGVTIHYRIVPETTKYYRPIVNGILTTRGELFGVTTPHASKFASTPSSMYGAMGAYQVKNELSVIVELSDIYPYREKQTRDTLQQSATNEPLTMQNFESMIVEYMPKELRDYINDKSKRHAEKELRSKTEEFSRDMLKELGLSLDGLVASQKGTETANRQINNPEKKTDVKKKDPKPSNKRGDKPTPAEKNKGMVEFHSEFLEGVELAERDFKKHEIGYIEGNYAYYNPNHPFIAKAVELVKTRESRINEHLIGDHYIKAVTRASVLATPFELSSEDTGAVLLAIGATLLAEGVFVNTLVSDYKKG